ncbi:DoxX family protein [Candidatus Gracilibacteria bacterium]|nr:DoxX family protein [Candidatus Gracilibacteria bacterium]
MAKKNKIAYWTSTLLFSVMILMGAVMYFAQYEMVTGVYTSLGYPSYLVYPLAIAKFLGIAAILSGKSELLKNLAYAGFFFLLVLATAAHLQIADGGFAPALVALVLLVISYFTQKK